MRHSRKRIGKGRSNGSYKQKKRDKQINNYRSARGGIRL